MKKLFGSLVLALCLALVAPSAAHAAMTTDEAGAKAIALLESMADIVDKDQANCDGMATDLNKFLDDNGATLKELAELKAKRSEADKKALQDKYGARLAAAKQKMMAGGQKCEKNDKVKAAFGRIQ